LTSDFNTLTIRFVGLSFREDAGLVYQYRLANLNPEWSPRGTERQVTFAQLPPGPYNFEVRAMNSEGRQSLQPASLTFTILPPFWRTWWAYCSYAILTIAGLALWRRYEFRSIRQKEREASELREVRLRAEVAEVRAQAAETQKQLEQQQTRIQIARDLHDEVGSTLSSIGLFAQAMTRKTGATSHGDANRFLALITESSSHAKEAISDIIWSIDPGNDNWEIVISKFRRYSSDILETRNIKHKIEMETPPATVAVDPHHRRHLWLLLKEIMTNIVKHSSCTEATILLGVTDGTIHLMVKDNGIGFDSTVTHEGNGLRNIYARTSALGASVSVESSREQGTRWTIVLPLRSQIS